MKKTLIIVGMVGVLSANLLIPALAGAATCQYYIASHCPNYVYDTYNPPASGTSSNGGATNRPPTWNYVGNKTVFAGQVLQFTVTATDPENDWLYYDILNTPAGAWFDRTMHTFYWNPSEGDVGTYGLTFTVSDGNSIVYKNVTVTVLSNGGQTGGNDNGGSNGTGGTSGATPIWSQTGDKNATVGQYLQFTVSAYDPNSNSGGITYTALNLPSGASFDSNSHFFSWNPQNYQVGTYVVTFRAHNAYGNSDLNVTIHVSAASGNTSNNNPPQFFSFNPVTGATVNQLYSYIVHANDPDGDALTYYLIVAPSGMSINSTTGFIAFVPTAGQVGTQPVKVGVSDGTHQATADYTLTVYNAGTSVPVPTPGTTGGNGGGTGATVPVEPKLVISDIKIENKDGDIVVSWKTNIPAGSRIIYDTASEADRTRNFSYANATSENQERFTSHSVNLGKLDTNTVYYFRVVSKTDQQTAVGQEVGFIQLENGQVKSLFGASLIEALGNLFGNRGFLWLLIAGLGTTTAIFFRKHRKSSLTV